MNIKIAKRYFLSNYLDRDKILMYLRTRFDPEILEEALRLLERSNSKDIELTEAIENNIQSRINSLINLLNPILENFNHKNYIKNEKNEEFYYHFFINRPFGVETHSFSFSIWFPGLDNYFLRKELRKNPCSIYLETNAKNRGILAQVPFGEIRRILSNDDDVYFYFPFYLSIEDSDISNKLKKVSEIWNNIS